MHSEAVVLRFLFSFISATCRDALREGSWFDAKNIKRMTVFPVILY